MDRTLIVYACPTGALSEQIDRYFAAMRALFGPGAADAYMPHCSLTGFFHDDDLAIPRYADALRAALHQELPARPEPAIRIAELLLRDDFHGFTLESEWLQQLVANFARQAHSPTRREALRLKTRLHLSLAYGFPQDQAATRAQYARSLIDPAAAVGWELRFYERLPDGGWRCHAAYPLC